MMDMKGLKRYFHLTTFLLVSILMTTLILPLSASDETDVYVGDRYGNVVFKNRTVKYARPIPVGNADYVTNLNYDVKSLDGLYSFARSFIQDVQPNSFPFDLLEKAANNQFDFATDSKKLVAHFYGLAIFFVLGVVGAAAFIIGGLCFCCCRGCCGNLGGDETQVYRPDEGRVRMALFQALLLMTLCVLSAAVCIYVTNDQFTDAVDFTNKSVTSNIDDIDRFLKNAGAQLQYTVTDMYEIIHQAMVKDIDDLGNRTAIGIGNELKIYTLVMQLTMLDEYLTNVSALLGQTNVHISELQRLEADVIGGLGALADDIDVTQTSCAGACAPDLCRDVISGEIRLGSNNTSNMLPNLSDLHAKVESFNSTNFTDIGSQAFEDLQVIGNRIDSLSGNIRRGMKVTLLVYRTLINGLAYGVFQTMKESFPAEQMKKQASDIFDTVGKYDKYRRWFGFALTTLFVSLIAVILLAMAIGTWWDDVTALPTERNSMSNLGGNILLFAMATMFLTGALLTFLASLAFLFGGLLEKSCEPIEDLTVFRDFLDEGKVPGYSPSLAILGVSIIELSTFDILIRCRADQTPWEAFRMEEIVPLDSALNVIRTMGDIGRYLRDIQNIDISSYKVFTPRLSNSISDLQALGLSQIDFQLIHETTEIPALLFNVDETIATMQQIASHCNSPVKDRWLNHARDLQTLKATTIDATEKTKLQLGVSSSLLYSHVKTVENLTESILQIAKAADDRISTNMTEVLLQASVGLFGELLSLVDGYATEVIYVIHNDLANCLPMWNLLKSMTVVLCDYGVDSLNGYWFSIGWGVLFFFPMIVVGAKLSKHFKVMESAVGYYQIPDGPKVPVPAKNPGVGAGDAETTVV